MVNVITLTLSQSDHKKQLQLYLLKFICLNYLIRRIWSIFSRLYWDQLKLLTSAVTLLWAPLYVIADNVCNQIYPELQVPNYSVIPNVNLSSLFCKFHSVNGISYGLAQSDPIRMGPLYFRSAKCQILRKLPSC